MLNASMSTVSNVSQCQRRSGGPDHVVHAETQVGRKKKTKIRTSWALKLFG
jgi:hypothetical protein